MAKQIHILNGPNLNLLGVREPELYGADTLSDVETKCAALAAELGLDLTFRQTNYEGELVDHIQAARSGSDGLIINPAAYSHTSVALLDALSMYDGPVIEVHISQIHKRESFRHHSYVSARADAVLVGCGINGYLLAMQQMALLLGKD